MYKIVKRFEAIVREIAKTYHARNYITKDISPNVSLAVNTANQHTEIETTQYDQIYYVINGRLNISANNQRATLDPSDSIIISKGTSYEFSGSFEAVVINQPAFGT